MENSGKWKVSRESKLSRMDLALEWMFLVTYSSVH